MLGNINYIIARNKGDKGRQYYLFSQLESPVVLVDDGRRSKEKKLKTFEISGFFGTLEFLVKFHFSGIAASNFFLLTILDFLCYLRNLLQECYADKREREELGSIRKQ